jgi:probable F420-dependent oxidoreductase
MKFDLTLLSFTLAEMADYAQAAERLGFDGFWLAETKGDPFLGLTLAAEHSQQMTLGTAIAVAFPRSPTTTAYIAWDLARYSNGRFTLGLGSQVKAHNVLRYGVKWEKPIKKMRETIQAIRACWDCWQNDKPLDYVGEFFKLQLMTPFFNPGPIEHPNIPIYVSAVNEQMLRLAGEECDGVHLHALHSVRYIEEFALPHIEAGLAKRGKGREGFGVVTAVFAIPTDDPTYAAWAEHYARQQICLLPQHPRLPGCGRVAWVGGNGRSTQPTRPDRPMGRHAHPHHRRHPRHPGRARNLGRPARHRPGQIRQPARPRRLLPPLHPRRKRSGLAGDHCGL